MFVTKLSQLWNHSRWGCSVLWWSRRRCFT